MKIRNKNNMLRVFASMTAVAVTGVMAFTTLFASNNAMAIGRDGYKAVLDYETLEDAQAAAADLNQELTGEGSVLLKNDGTLTLAKGARITVFGSAATSLQGASGSIGVPEALGLDGFDVNPNVVTESNAEDTANEDIRLYNEAAVIVLKRGGGEGSDLATTSSEEATEEAKRSAAAQFAYYGIPKVDDETLSNYANNILSNKEENRKIYEKLFENKVVNAVLDQITVNEQTVSAEDFGKLAQEAQQ